jgi:hypothetical protein
MDISTPQIRGIQQRYFQGQPRDVITAEQRLEWIAQRNAIIEQTRDDLLSSVIEWQQPDEGNTLFLPPRDLAIVNRFVIHHSHLGSNIMDMSNPERIARIEAVQTWNILLPALLKHNFNILSSPWFSPFSQRLSGIVYHYIIMSDGEIFNTQQLDSVTFASGVIGKPGANNTAIQICLDGDFESILPSNNQLDALRELIYLLQNDFPNSHILGHDEHTQSFGSKPQKNPCPGKTFYGPNGWNRLLD